MDAQQLIETWEERRQQIFRTLPEPMRLEYERLGHAIRLVETELTRQPPQPEPSQSTQPLLIQDAAVSAAQIINNRRQRVPLMLRKRELIQFLRNHGPAARGEIVRATNIPNGSLGNLLNEPEFVNDHGVWKVREERNDPA